MKRLVITTHLEMTDRACFRPARPPAVAFQLVRVELPCPELNRFLYTAVGADWYWYSRLSWNYAEWLAYLDRPELETWVAYVAGTPAGYFELERQAGSDVEIAYFGVLPGFIGKGIGGALLSEAIARAWDMGAERVWVHTCTLDHFQACRNYQARGFTVFRTEQKVEDLPDHPLEPWPGAERRGQCAQPGVEPDGPTCGGATMPKTACPSLAVGLFEPRDAAVAHEQNIGPEPR